jgi:hypothetical protein
MSIGRLTFIRPLLDPVLGARLKTQLLLAAALRQVRLRRDRRARPSPGADLATPSLAQRLLLRCHPLYPALPLPVPVLARRDPQGMDPRRAVLPGLQHHLRVVQSRELLHHVRDPRKRDGGPDVRGGKAVAYREQCAGVPVFGPVGHVLFVESGKSATGEQVGVYECDPRVWSYHNLYDRKFPVVFVIFPAFLIFFIYYYFDCFDCFDHVLN